MFKPLLFLLLVIGVVSSYCQTTSQSNSIFYLANETQSIALQDYIKGYNLDFQTSDPSISKIQQPLWEFASNASTKLPPGYQLLSIDYIDQINSQGASPLILVAYNPSTNKVIINEGSTRKDFSLPKIYSTKEAELSIYDPTIQNLVCFNAVLLNGAYDVAFDCQSDILGATVDTICVVTQDKGECFSKPTDVKTTGKKTSTLSVANQSSIYILSATLTLSVSSNYTNNTSIKISKYMDGLVSFVSEVNADKLSLESLSITDIKVDLINRVIVSSVGPEFSTIITFEFDGKEILNVQIQDKIPAEIRSLEQTNRATILLADRKNIIQYDYPTFSSVIRKYELDPIDNQVVQTQSNDYYLIVKTSKDNLYMYSRGKTQLKYLRAKLNVQRNTLILGFPFTKTFLKANSTHMTQHQLTQGFMLISGIKTQTSLSFVGVSDKSQICSVQLTLKIISNIKDIFVKQSFTDLPLSLSSGDSFEIVLSNYFGGSSLTYDVPQSSSYVKIGYVGITKYIHQSIMPPVQFYQIIGINNMEYYYIGIDNNKNLYIDHCTVKGDTAICTNQKNLDFKNNLTVSGLHGARRENGDMVISWCYNGNIFEVYTIGKSRTTIYTGNDYHYSSVRVSEKYVFLTQKKQNQIFILLSTTNTATINKRSFTTDQLELMGGFYPREIILSSSNPDVFYVKLQKSIACMGIEGTNVRLLYIVNINDEFYLDDTWTVAVGKQSVLVITPDSFKQFSIRQGNLLHSSNFQSDIVLPIDFDPITDTVYFRTVSNQLIAYRLNKPASQSVILQIPTKSVHFTVSWGWLLIPEDNVAYLIPKRNFLTVKTLFLNNIFKYSYNLSVTAKGLPDVAPISQSVNITIINYPTQIKQVKPPNNLINLPINADNIQIDFPIQDYFTGSIISYTISCPYLKNISLLQPFRISAQLPEITDLSDIAFGDNNFIVMLSNNYIYVLNPDNTIQSTTKIDDPTSCQKLALYHHLSSHNLESPSLGNQNLLVLCTSPDKQEIKQYTILEDGSAELLVSFNLEQSHYIINPKQIYVSDQENGQSWLLIHDSDKTQSSDERQANIKVFRFSHEELEFLKIIDSHQFIGNPNIPINGMHVYREQESDQFKEFLVVSLGGLGIGFSQLNEPSNSQCLKNPIYINLRHSSIQDYTLDTTHFMSVQIISILASNIVGVFVQSSNAAHIAISFNVSSPAPISFKLLQTYNRLGNEASYNWVAVTNNLVLLSYYNSSTKVLTVGLYNRSQSTPLMNMYASVSSEVPSEIMRNNLLGVNGQYLYILSGKKVLVYEFDKKFGLNLNYNSPGDFSIITVKAKNQFSEANHDVFVHFDKNQTSDGLKWYIVVVIVIGSLLFVGLAYGCYRKVKSDRKKKKVSLVTEGGDDNQQI